MRLVHPLSAPPLEPDVVGLLGACLGGFLSLDLPVAPGFAIGTAAWHLDRVCGADWGLPETVSEQVGEALAELDTEGPVWVRASPLSGRDGERWVRAPELEGAVQQLFDRSALPTAVVVQARAPAGGWGKALTRDPLRGTVWPTGEFRTVESAMDLDAFSRWMPQVAVELRSGLGRIESLYKTVCEVSFSLADGTLWFDDARPLRHSPEAGRRLTEAGLRRPQAGVPGSSG